MIKQGCVLAWIEAGEMHMTPSYSTHLKVINMCPIALTGKGRKLESRRKKVEVEPEQETKKVLWDQFMGAP